VRYYWTVTDLRWRLPVTVEFNDTGDILTVRLSELTLLKKQTLYLVDRLNSNCFNKDAKAWYFARAEFEKIASPFEGEDIEDSVEWTPMVGTVPRREIRGKGPSQDEATERDEFLMPLVVAGVFKTLDAANIMWSIFITVMKDRLINDQKPIPMGFARLYAFPYRVNWVQTVFDHDVVKLKKEYSRGHDVRSKAGIVARGTAHFMTDEILTAWNPDLWQIQWTLNVVPTADWDALVTDAETTRKGVRRRAGYLPGIVDTMRRLLPSALDVYLDYLQRVRLPYVLLYSRLRDRSGRITSQGNARQGCPKPSHSPRNQPICFDPAVETSSETVGECPNSGVRAMFRFQPGNEKVWEPRNAVGEPFYRPEKSNGMPVPDGFGGKI
jgi:hypothetical protein